MNKIFYFLMGGLLLAMVAIVEPTESAALARKTGGATERLLEKKRHQNEGASQNQPSPEQLLARKVGGARTRLLWQVRHRQA